MSKLTKTGKVAKTYTCEKCEEVFDQKGHYERHLSRKIPCDLKDKTLTDFVKEEVKKEIKNITKKNKSTKKKKGTDEEDEIEEETEKKLSKKNKSTKNKKVEEVEIDYSYLRLPENKVIYELKDDDGEKKSKSKSKIIDYIDKAHDILYQAENIEGEDALNDIMNFLFIKAIQPIISDKQEEGKFDLLNKKYYKNLYDDEEELDEILGYVKDLSLVSQQPLKTIRDLNESNDIIRKIGEILKTHPVTKMIYIDSNFIKARKPTTIQLLLNNVINKINIKEIEENEDVIGEIYEHIINGYVKKGSKLSQFFTPRKLMKLILNYKFDRIEQIIKELDKKSNIKIGDTCMGTGGWLVIANNMLKNKYEKRILLNGGEVKPSTFQYGLMNLILTLRKFPNDVRCESSLSHINNIKNHLILTNPPFQTDKKFDQVKQNFNEDSYTKSNNIKIDEIYKLKDNNPPIQFLELDLYKLEENGMCIIILPYGELFFGSSYKDARKYFMENCNITDIILFSGGVFTHTGIKTCALIFEKDKKGTNEINYLQADKDCKKITKITSLKIEDIKKEPNKSWYLRDYLKDEYIEDLVSKMTNYEWVEFEKLFTLEKGKIQSSKVEENKDGEIIFISKAEISENTIKIDSEIYYDGGVFIAQAFNGNGKCPIRYTNEKCIHSDLMYYLKLNKKYSERINLKFIYYYLKSIQDHIEVNYEKGSCNKSLDLKNFNRMKIPIPGLDKQEKIMEYTMFLESDTLNTLSLAKNNELKRKFYMECMIRGATNKNLNTLSTIGKECEIEYGTRITKEENEIEFSKDDENLYPVYGGGDISFYTNKFNRQDLTCKISRFGMSEHNCVINLKKKYYLNDSGFTISSKNENKLLNTYLWNYLWLIKKSIYNTGSELAQRNINMDKFKNITLPIQPIDYQKRMEKTLKDFDWFKEYYEKRINDNEEEIKTSFIDSLDSYGNPNTFNFDKIIIEDEKNSEDDELEKEFNQTKVSKIKDTNKKK